VKILLVEDNEMNRDMLSRRLIKRGFDVPMAENGQLAVEMAASEKPDLILMDISLPIMDGYAATRAIRANAETAGVPIIALTANANESDRAEAMAAGCNDYDTKPVDVNRLMDKIQALLPAS